MKLTRRCNRRQSHNRKKCDYCIARWDGARKIFNFFPAQKRGENKDERTKVFHLEVALSFPTLRRRTMRSWSSRLWRNSLLPSRRRSLALAGIAFYITASQRFARRSVSEIESWNTLSVKSEKREKVNDRSDGKSLKVFDSFEALCVCVSMLRR